MRSTLDSCEAAELRVIHDSLQAIHPIEKRIIRIPLLNKRLSLLFRFEI